MLRDALNPHRSTLTPKLWAILESVKPGDAGLLPSASALASYAPDNARWEAVGGKVAQALVSVNAILLGTWIEALRPVRASCRARSPRSSRTRLAPSRNRKLATNILANYASDDPNRLAELLMVADSKAYLSLFPVAEKRAEQVLPVLQSELARKATYSWNDPPLDPPWTEPDAALVSRIESAQGMLIERFAFCQTMPLDEFVTTAKALRESGYRPVRFRPYADGTVTRVAAVWTRDRRNWRLAPGDCRGDPQAGREEPDGEVPPGRRRRLRDDVDGRPTERYAALWAEGPGDDARLYLGVTDDELADAQKPLDDAKLIPRTLHALRSPDGRTRYSGVWGKPPSPGVIHRGYRDLFAWELCREPGPVQRPGARRRRGRRGRQAAVGPGAGQGGDRTGGEDAQGQIRRLDASAPGPRRLRLGENDKALDDLNAVLAKSKDDLDALELRAIARARLGKKDPARSDLARYQKDAPERSRLCRGDHRRGRARRRDRRRGRGPGSRDPEGAGGRRPALRRRPRLRGRLEGRPPGRPREGAHPGRAGPRIA